MIRAEVVADSVSPYSKRITTFKTRGPRFIHAEFMTHRMLSRNASSSRAVPFAKKLLEVTDPASRAAPVFWGAEQKGMQTGAELPSKFDKVNDKHVTDSYHCIEHAQETWERAALEAARHAQRLSDIGVHKSICNRIIEPFTHIDVVVTATEWDNFFGLRLDEAAEPTMRALTLAMWEAMSKSMPKPLNLGQWHLPYADDAETADQVEAWLNADNVIKGPVHSYSFETNLYMRVSVARCARVSYESFETGRRSTVEEDLRLYDRLLAAQPLHASPAEHQATPDEYRLKTGPQGDVGFDGFWLNQKEHGNLVGWRQYRKMLPGESRAPLPEAYR